MKTAIKVVSLAAFLAIAPSTHSADIINGWSGDYTGGPARISEVMSFLTTTFFKLPTSAGCGSAQYWSLPLTGDEASRYKRAALLATYMVGKRVSLRCENSRITDFQIMD